MQIYKSNQKGPLKMDGYIDPNDVTVVRLNWGADPWLPNHVFRANDIVKPTVDNGYYYTVSTNGRSSTSEPTWTQDETTDNTTVFVANPWDLWLMHSETLQTSEWVATTGVTLELPYKGDTYTTINITAVNPALTQFEITNQVSKSNGEKLSRTLLFKINQQ